jgi:LSD1 subclass zinc finger protein
MADGERGGEDGDGDVEVRAVAVTCNGCGAPLDVPAGTRFVTCAYCRSRLEIHRSGNAVYSEVLDAIDQRTRAIAESVADIRRQNEVERLDREWAMRRDELLVRDKRGNASPPTAAGSVIGAAIAAVFGIGWTVFAARMGAPGFFVAFGAIFVIVALVGGAMGAGRAGRYADERRAYERRRAEAMAEREG